MWKVGYIKHFKTSSNLQELSQDFKNKIKERNIVSLNLF